MTANKTWGILLIVIGVIMIFGGLATISSTYDQATQLQAISNMAGGLGNSLMSGAKSTVEDGYMKGAVISVIGLVLSIIGTKLMQKKEKSE